MLWLEMSRDLEHGGGSWGFTHCLWSPTKKQAQDGSPSGEQRWWENILKVKEGDIILHLRREGEENAFVGFSIAETDGECTAERPPSPGSWGYDTHFYRALLRDFQPFSSSLDLHTVFMRQEKILREYFQKNKMKSRSEKKTLFYVIQANRLQCQNGAYLSEVDEELAEIILHPALLLPTTSSALPPKPALSIVETREQYRQMRTRVGQQAFAEKIRANYHIRCCFPDCPIAEERFLIGSHIARWVDVPELRGHLNNGLCLCLLHDKAFEVGLFTIDKNLCIFVNRDNEAVRKSRWCQDQLLPYHGHAIRRGEVLPSEEALHHHWTRIGISMPIGL